MEAQVSTKDDQIRSLFSELLSDLFRQQIRGVPDPSDRWVAGIQDEQEAYLKKLEDIMKKQE